MTNFREVRVWLLLAGLVLLVALPALAMANPGWLTTEAPYITLDPGVPAGSTVKALISSGEMVDGVRFQGLPDGIGTRSTFTSPTRKRRCPSSARPVSRTPQSQS